MADFIVQVDIDRLNRLAWERILAGESGRAALIGVADDEGLQLVVSSDGGTATGSPDSLRLYRRADGAYATLWLVSNFGEADDAAPGGKTFDVLAVGFDNDPSLWTQELERLESGQVST